MDTWLPLSRRKNDLKANEMTELFKYTKNPGGFP